MTVRRRFLDLDDLQIHYRERESDGPPLLLLHHLPGSTVQTVPLMRAIEGRRLIAPDLAGLGDSDPHPLPAPTIADYADDVAQVIERLGLGAIDVYGSHTGAAVAVELAVARPELVGRLILDGVPLWSAEERVSLAAKYLVPVEPDLNGGHLLAIHNMCRDMLLFWPWYEKSAAANRGGGLPPARDLHRWVLEVIKAMDTLGPAYRAVFEVDLTPLLRAVGQPALCIVANGDPLRDATEQAAKLLPNASVHRIDTGTSMAPAAEVATAIEAFLGR